MSDYIDTREGWRRLDPYEETHRPELPTLTEHDAAGKFVAFWVREEPMPPLPTEPYTVIRVTWKPLDARQTFEFVRLDGIWRNKHGEVLDPADIETFEVLAEPRAVTAWAVLDRISDMPSVKVALTAGDFRKVADEFGVES